MSSINPEELFKKMYASASTRKKKSLSLINEACKIQHRTALKDFSLGKISEMIKDNGGPCEQALRNKGAEDYRDLIGAWAEFSETDIKKPKKKRTSTTEEEILSSITDPTIRALMGITMAENRKLKNENHMLKHNTTYTIDMRNNQNNSCTVSVSSFDFLTDTEKEALKEAVSENFFQSWGLVSDDFGRILLKDSGTTVHKVGYTTAIKKILEHI